MPVRLPNYMYLTGLIFLFQLVASPHLLSQFNIYSANVTLVGLGVKSTVHEDFLGKVIKTLNEDKTISREYFFNPEYAKGLSMDCRHINLARNSVISVSGESALYLLGELTNTSSDPYEGGFNFVVGQQTESFIDRNISGMAEYQKRWINLRHTEANATFGARDLQIGLHASLRSIGYTDFTFFGNESGIFDTGELVTKLLMGPAIGFRKTIDNVNVIAFGSISGSMNTKESYKLKYSPHSEITLFLGKKFGVFTSFYFRSYKGHVTKYEQESVQPWFWEFAFHGGLFFCNMH